MLVSLIICFITGLFLPMFVLGISISAKTRNERFIYYSMLCVTLIVMRLVWGGTGKGVNIILLVFILLFGVACYKAHDKVFSILGGIRNILSIYMGEIKKMSLTTTAGPINGESNGSVLNMKKILKYTLFIESIIIICSIIGLYTGGQCLSIVVGTVSYIAIMHGFLLKDDALLGAIDSIRRSTRVKLGLIDEDLPQPIEDTEDDNDDDNDDSKEGQSKQSARKKKKPANRGDIEESAIAEYVMEKNKKEKVDKVIKSIMDEDGCDEPTPVNKRIPGKREEKRIIETVEKEELPVRRRPASTTRPIRTNMQYEEIIDDEEDTLGYKPTYTESRVEAPKKRRLMQELSNGVNKERVQKQPTVLTDEKQSNRSTPTESKSKNPYVDENGNTTIPRRGRLFSDE